MRRVPMVFTACIVSACGSGDGGAGAEFPLDCPVGTTPFGAPQGTGTHYWCEDADGLAQGPYAYRSTNPEGVDFVVFAGQFVDGEQDGVFVRYYGADGAVFQEESYRLGLPHGPWTEYARDGEVAVERSFSMGSRCGTWRDRTVTPPQAFDYPACADDGEPAQPTDPEPVVEAEWDGAACPGGAPRVSVAGGEEERWCEVAGVRDGPYGVWRDGVQVVDGHYAGGKRSGRWALFYGDGSPRALGEYAPSGDHGQRTGTWSEWRPDGTASARGDYLADDKAGPWTTWWITGAKASEGSFLAGKESGPWTRWDGAGKKTRDETWADGLLDGPYTSYHDGAQVDARGAYWRGLPDGLWDYYWPSGTQRRRERVARGLIDFLLESYDLQGRLVASLPAGPDGIDGTGRRLHYFDEIYPPTGRSHVATVESTWVDSLQQGPFQGTWDTGHPYSEGSYVDGALHGPMRVFYPDGGPWLDMGWVAGRPHGTWTRYAPDGAVLETCDYALGAGSGCFLVSPEGDPL